MKRTSSCVKTLACLLGFLLFAGTLRAAPPLVFLSASKLDAAKARIAAGDAEAAKRLAPLSAQAAKMMKVSPLPSVTLNDYTAPGGTKNDYYSFGIYWWPDPNKEDGLPFIRKDGVVNKEIRKKEYGADNDYMTEMCKAVETLALSYYLTGNAAHGEKAAAYLRCFFLDPKTRMNPNFKFGQGIPGRNTGRAAGIIETLNLIGLLDMVELLTDCPAWAAEEHQGLQNWFKEYTNWLLTSKIGKQEGRAANNHGTWYDLQVTRFALFYGDREVARSALRTTLKRIDSQIEADGKQPHELARTRPFAYSTMNLRAFIQLANLGEQLDVDLWEHRSPKGGSVRAAVDFLLPFAEKKAEWTYDDLDFKPGNLGGTLRYIGGRFDGLYREKADKLTPIRDYSVSAFLQ